MLQDASSGLSFSPTTLFVIGIVLLIFAITYLRRLGVISLPSLKSAGHTGEIPFTIDLTDKARLGKIDPVVGRGDEITRVVHILSRRTKNNPLLVGPAGVGKTAIVEGLALKIATNDVPTYLQDKRVLSLNVPDLLSGTKYRGDFEQRVQMLLKSLEGTDRSIILFIDEIHVLVQTKGTEGAINVTDILKPSLARGELQVVGATSLKEYKEYIEPDETLERRFQIVLVDEPTVKEAIEILKGVKVNYEDYHDVTITDEAVESAVKLSHEYIKNRRLPDKAIDLIDEAGATVKVESNSTPDSAIALLHNASYHTRCAFDSCPPELLALKEQLRTLKNSEKRTRAKAAREKLHEQMVAIVRQIEEMERALTKKQGRPRVTPTEIKRIVSEWTKIPVKQLH